MRALAFAWRSLVRQPGRAGLGVLGVAAVGALLFDMLLLSRGLLVSFQELLGGYGFDVRVAAVADLGRVEAQAGSRIRGLQATMAALAALPEVADIVPLRFGQVETQGKDHQALEVTLIGAQPGLGRQWTVVEGRDLDSSPGDGPTGALLNRALANGLNLRPGATLSLRGVCAPDRLTPPVRVSVLGIASFPFDSKKEMTAFVNLAAFSQICGDPHPDQADLLLVASRDGSGPDAAAEAIRRARPELHAFTNEEIVARFQRLQFSYFRQISAALATLTLLFGFLLITVLLTVSVNQRLGEIAALRALGFSRRRVVADVLCQSLLLVGSGALLSLPLGLAMSTWLDAILKGMPGVPVNLHFFVFEPRALGQHMALLSLTALFAALYPMRLVARLPIAATLRDEVGS